MSVYPLPISVTAPYSVTQLNREVRALVEGGFPMLWVEGEISNLSRPASGHVYFTLKDEQAQVRCALFRQRALLLRFEPANGQQVRVRARVSLYEPRGEFQLLVEHIGPVGAGALALAFEALKRRLAAEGLFDAAHKRPLPAWPARVGVLTSATGAALRDVLTVLRRRCALLPVVVYPVPVQGAAAAGAIAAMLARAGERAECDVLILARGGGALEDLWAFNEEVLVRAIRACPLPIVTGVGHEIDFTIADLAADARAPTPSAAAELVSPDLAQAGQRLDRLAVALAQMVRARLAAVRDECTRLARRLAAQHPRRRLAAQRAHDRETVRRLHGALAQALTARRGRLTQLSARLSAQNPLRTLATRRSGLTQRVQRLHTAFILRQREAAGRLATAAETLHAISPLATLARGYALAQAADGRILRSAAHTAPGERVRLRLAAGQLICIVEETQS